MTYNKQDLSTNRALLLAALGAGVSLFIALFIGINHILLYVVHNVEIDYMLLIPPSLLFSICLISSIVFTKLLMYEVRLYKKRVVNHQYTTSGKKEILMLLLQLQYTTCTLTYNNDMCGVEVDGVRWDGTRNKVSVDEFKIIDDKVTNLINSIKEYRDENNNVWIQINYNDGTVEKIKHPKNNYK